jgi:hypothetical protein
MKKLILILLITVFSCSKEDINTCECSKSFYERESYVYFNEQGIPQLGWNENFLYSEPVICTDEVQKVFVNDTNFYNITCE